MKGKSTSFVLLVIVEQMLGAVLFAGHLADAQEIEENLSAHRKSIAEHDHRSDFPHAGFIRSEKELEEIQNLPPDEAKDKLRIILVEIDLDLNGEISKKELSTRLLETYRSLSNEEADSEFDDSDLDNDGFITWKEYVTDTYALNEDDISISEEEEDDVAADEKAIFNAADTDGDLKLSKVEFRSFYTPEDYPHMVPLIVKDVLNEVDLDNDGKVTLDEFLKNKGHDGSDTDKEWVQAEKIKFHRDYDSNSDGVLEGEEIISWLLPNNNMLSMSEAEDLISKYDQNDDGQLSFKEILDNYKEFVLSTNNYSHLDYKDEL
ncbi:reticulocalbin-2-like [Adelges cooleyi]|uniref:reticulocalbin-2-like n=1 Tax=Adelges cooleyi TaxID=133065 RepID=UPI00218013CF|nr:reticulocalbin-2-like [Adelges cooleyi]